MEKTLAIASFEDETIRLWDAHTGKHKKTFTAPHDRYIGRFSVQSGWKKHSQVVAAMALSVYGVHTPVMKNIHFTGHSQRLFSAGAQPEWRHYCEWGPTTGIINFWDADTGTNTSKTLNGLRDGFVGASGQSWCSVRMEGHSQVVDTIGIRLWDVQTGEHKMQLAKQTDAIVSVAFSPDGKNPRKWESG